jgi:GNAT superfamily N-acetyltransferase
VLEIKVSLCNGRKLWPIFAPYHYLRSDYFGHGALIATIDKQIVGFASFISFPSGTISQPARREHRTVIIPDFQGMGIGVKLSDFLGEYCLKQGFRFFSKTTHPRMGLYREESILWKATSKNRLIRTDQRRPFNSKWEIRRVASYSHEYIGHDLDLYKLVMENRLIAASEQQTLFNI